MTEWVALIRAINVGGRNAVPMAPLREACSTIGLRDVASYIASGNLVFRSDAAQADIETALEDLLVRGFDVDAPVVVRSAPAWSAYVRSNPFMAAAAERPNLVMLGIGKRAAPADAAPHLEAMGQAGERVAVAEDGLWIDFAGGAGRSKITPRAIDRAVGAPVTTRNWRTVMKLETMLGDLDG